MFHWCSISPENFLDIKLSEHLRLDLARDEFLLYFIFVAVSLGTFFPFNLIFPVLTYWVTFFACQRCMAKGRISLVGLLLWVSLLLLSSQQSGQNLWGSHHTWKARSLARAQFFLVAFLPLAVTIERQSPCMCFSFEASLRKDCERISSSVPMKCQCILRYSVLASDTSWSLVSFLACLLEVGRTEKMGGDIKQTETWRIWKESRTLPFFLSDGICSWNVPYSIRAYL